jgi:hypothetical protein
MKCANETCGYERPIEEESGEEGESTLSATGTDNADG